jgi:hypothetical protein
VFVHPAVISLPSPPLLHVEITFLSPDLPFRSVGWVNC